ncbi:hypothetical protein GCM10010389_49320 [Streptomyces echinoruber]|uniref:Transposase n=1 Tax=Streptomyces echinoruber TaxID=68898 RepID=A0A918VK34_9ACTN|nr:hypothetical protein GCM10010389_49320 [Streptomyces echinoruber]
MAGIISGMRLGEVERLRGELAEFVADAFASLPRRDQRRWGTRYLRGLTPDGRRKSIEQSLSMRPRWVRTGAPR